MTGDRGAACAGVLEPLWDATVDGENELEQIARHTRALAYCGSCPIRRQCAAEIDVSYDDGIRGGLVLQTLPDHARRSPTNRQPGRGGLAQVLAGAA